MTEHLCLPKMNLDGSSDIRLAGDKPIDCGVCGRAMTLKEHLDNMEKVND